MIITKSHQQYPSSFLMLMCETKCGYGIFWVPIFLGEG